MERAHKRSLKTLDAEGLPREVGGACDAALACQEAIGTAFNVGIPDVEGAAFEYHTHGDGFYRVPGDIRVIGSNPSPLDLGGAKGLGYPAYIVAKNTIYRLTYDSKKDKVNVDTFKRWTP